MTRQSRMVGWAGRPLTRSASLISYWSLLLTLLGTSTFARRSDGHQGRLRGRGDVTRLLGETVQTQSQRASRHLAAASVFTPTPPLCVGLLCPGTQHPSSAVFASNATCDCASPLVALLTLVPALSPFSSQDADTLRQSVAAALGLSLPQVWLSLVAPSAKQASAQDATLWIFRPDLDMWNTVDVSVMVDKFLSNSSITGLPSVASALASAALGSQATAPPVASSIYFPPGAPTSPASPPPSTPLASSPPAPESSSSGVPWWGILLIALAGLLLIKSVVLIFLFIYWYKRRQLQPEEEQLTKEESKAMSRRGDNAAAAPKTKPVTSEFGLKVQDNFVKALTLDELIEATNNFDEDNALGSGGYGTVYKGVAPGGVLWAVKRAKNASEEHMEDFQNEVDVISKMSHRNLVKLLGYCDERGEQILVYEFVPNGTLRQHIRPDNPNFAPLTFQQRLEIAVGSAEGLKYLHCAAEPAIIHRDIKCDNILLDMDMQAKVADFGVFKKSPTEEGKTMNTRVVGTPGYVDPEYYQTYKVTTKSDVYSFGVVLLELITGRPPIMEDPTVENESYMVTLSRWATPKIAAGKVETIVDPRLYGTYPRQALNMMAAITAMCVRRLGRDRPEMAEVATRLAEIKYFLKPSSGILEPVLNLFPEDRDDADNLDDIAEEEEDDQVPEFIPGTAHGINPYSTSDIAAPVSMVFSDR